MNSLRPKYLFDCLDEVRARLKRSKQVAVFLDLDGRLASIMRTPKLARIKPQTRTALQSLLEDSKYCVAVVSGREMQELKSIVKLSGISWN